MNVIHRESAPHGRLEQFEPWTLVIRAGKFALEVAAILEVLDSDARIDYRRTLTCLIDVLSVSEPMSRKSDVRTWCDMYSLALDTAARIYRKVEDALRDEGVLIVTDEHDHDCNFIRYEAVTVD